MIYETFIPSEEQLEEWEDMWEKSGEQYRDATTRYEYDQYRKVDDWSIGEITYYRLREQKWEGTTMVVNADDYPLLPKDSSLKCIYPGCNGVRGIHSSIITSHEFEEPYVLPGRDIVLPPNVRLWAHEKSLTIGEHLRCRCFPRLDVRILNHRDNDRIKVYENPLNYVALRSFDPKPEKKERKIPIYNGCEECGDVRVVCRRCHMKDGRFCSRHSKKVKEYDDSHFCIVCIQRYKCTIFDCPKMCYKQCIKCGKLNETNIVCKDHDTQQCFCNGCVPKWTCDICKELKLNTWSHDCGIFCKDCVESILVDISPCTLIEMLPADHPRRSGGCILLAKYISKCKYCMSGRTVEEIQEEEMWKQFGPMEQEQLPPNRI